MKDIEEFEGKYAITEKGEVWNYKDDKFQVLRGSGFIGKKLRHKRKYKTVALWRVGKRYTYCYVHRLVAQAFLPNPLNLPMVNHKDGNPENNTVENLEWCTHKENIKHAFENGLTTRGAKNAQTKLNREQVLEIRKRYSEGGVSQNKLAEEYGIAQTNVSLIVNRKNWSYL